jgi:hypothetical protein
MIGMIDGSVTAERSMKVAVDFSPRFGGRNVWASRSDGGIMTEALAAVAGVAPRRALPRTATVD